MRLLRALRAVWSAFSGIRQAGAAEADRQLKLREIIVAALLLAAVLIAGLLFVVRHIVALAGA